MPLFELTTDALREVPTTTLAAEQVLERDDLQRLLRVRPDILIDDVMIVSEEFGAFEQARRRIDLLGLDRLGHLIVIELKRTSDGGHLELQALRYAAMVSAMTFEDLVEHHDRYLAKVEPTAVGEARARLAEWLDDVGGESALLERRVRLLLVSGGFDREITTTVLWLNDVFGLDIRCVRLQPYKINGRLLLDVQQIIPLAEASDFVVQLRRREAEALKVRAEGGPDWTPYVIRSPNGLTEPLRKRRAVQALVIALSQAGVAAAAMADVLPGTKLRPVDGVLSGEPLVTAFSTAYPSVLREPRGLGRWFLETPLHETEQTWVLSKMWGSNTETVLDALLRLAPTPNFGYEAQPVGPA